MERIDPISSRVKVNYVDEEDDIEGAVVPLQHMLELDQEEEERRESVKVIESPREKVQIIQQVK